MSSLEEKYPDITSSNYDKNLYFKNIFDKILEYEKTYISDIIKKINLKKQATYWLDLDGFTFEREVSDLYRQLGYKVETTRPVADGGVDIRLWDKRGRYTIIQCKNHKNKVGPAIARELYGTMIKERAGKAILLCSGGFNKSVFDFVKGLSVELMDINQLIALAETIHPTAEAPNNISNVICRNDGRNLLLRRIADILILYSHSAKIVERDGKIIFSNPISSPIGNRFYIFETLEEIKNEIEIIKKQVNRPIQDSCIYDIGEWKMQSKTQSHHHKVFYYLRILKDDQRHFQSKPSPIYPDVPKPRLAIEDVPF